MRLGSQRGQIVCTDVLLLVVGACCVVWGFGNSWISGFQTLIVVIVVAIIYKSCLRDICGPEMRSKGVFKLAERGDIDGIKRELGKKDISINKRDEYNCTFLHWAVLNGQVEMAEYLIKNGIDLDAKNIFGFTALHLSVIKDRLDAARLLIEYGANKSVTNADNQTALDLAISTPMKILLNVPLFQSPHHYQGVVAV